jgi:putative ABC transport system permease protein
MTPPEIAALWRLARRTARRNWKRTVLIVALIAVPVAGAQVGAGMMAAGRVDASEYATQELGAADVNVAAYGASAQVRDWVGRTISEVAPGAEVLAYREVYGSIPGITPYAWVTDLDPSAPLAVGKLGIVAGRIPSDPSEVALSDALVTLTGAEVGEQVELAFSGTGPAPRTYTVVGVVRDVLWKNQSIALVSPAAMDAFFAAGQPDVYRNTRWLVGGVDDIAFSAELSDRWDRARPGLLPEPAVRPTPVALRDLPDDLYRSLTAEQIAHLEEYALNHPGWEVEEEAWSLIPVGAEFPNIGTATRAEYRTWTSGVDDVLQAPSLLGTLGAAVLLAEVALVAGAAYATGTRRRLRELGLMAVNGATDRHLRWAVVGEGLFTGLLGAGLGTIAGVAALVFGRPVMQRFIDRFIVGVPIGILEMLGPALVGVAAATIAAWVPARTAARVPATTALQGRMPLHAPRRWVAPLGLVLGVAGAFLLVVAKTASSSSGAYQAGLAVALMIGGFALLAGPMVAWVGARADRLPATLRLVARDSARQRTRAATAMAATMVVLLAPVLMGIALRTDQALQATYGLSEDGRQVLVGASDWRFAGRQGEGAAEAAAAIAGDLPSARRADLLIYDGFAVRSDVAAAAGSGSAGVPVAAGGYGGSPEYHPAAVGIARATPELVAALSLGLSDDEVAGAGAILLGRADGQVEVVVGDITIEAREVPARVLLYAMPRLLVTEATATSLGLVDGSEATLYVNDRPLTEQERITAQGHGQQYGTAVTVSIAPGFTAVEIEMMGVGATLFVVLVIVALVTALSATESDHDLRTMVAVGAPPRIRRRFLGTQAAYYSLFAAALATPLALLLYKVSVNDWGASVGPFGVHDSGSIVVPWAEIGVVALAVPAVVGAVTALAVRSAPTMPPRRVG